MKIIWHWLILSASLYAVTLFLPNQITFTPMYTVLVVGACLYFVNATIRPIIRFFTLAINFLTLGLFSVVISGVVFWSLTYVVSGFHIANFTAAIIGALIVSIVNWILEMIF
jgi:putative membrane protein